MNNDNGALTHIGDISDFDDVVNACWFFGTDMSRKTGDGSVSCCVGPIITRAN